MNKQKALLEDLEREAWLRARNEGAIIWRTKFGNEIPIKDMSDTHLHNTIEMLIKNENLSDLACEYEAYIDQLD